MSPPRFAGLHLSGPNAHKTAVVIASGHPLQSPLTIEKVYEKIGSFGSLFSDERVLEILVHEGPLEQIFVDCPLTVPPCVACTRPQCPGPNGCEDMSVAYMLSLSQRVKSRAGRKFRPLNPQSQRLWDVLRSLEADAPKPEPSYSANLSPLVNRAVTLQRRLNALRPSLQLEESNVPQLLNEMATPLGLASDIGRSYRNFERGHDRRLRVLERLYELRYIALECEESLAELAKPLEVFHAVLMAWMGGLKAAGLVSRRPQDYLPHEGWVYLPKVSAPATTVPPALFD